MGLDHEAVLDRNDGVNQRWTGWSPNAERAKKEVSIAGQHLEAKTEAINPSDWSALAQQASTIYDHMLRSLRVRQAQERTMAAGAPQAEQHPHIDQSLVTARKQLGRSRQIHPHRHSGTGLRPPK